MVEKRNKKTHILSIWSPVILVTKSSRSFFHTSSLESRSAIAHILLHMSTQSELSAPIESKHWAIELHHTKVCVCYSRNHTYICCIFVLFSLLWTHLRASKLRFLTFLIEIYEFAKWYFVYFDNFGLNLDESEKKVHNFISFLFVFFFSTNSNIFLCLLKVRHFSLDRNETLTNRRKLNIELVTGKWGEREKWRRELVRKACVNRRNSLKHRLCVSSPSHDVVRHLPIGWSPARIYVTVKPLEVVRKSELWKK